MKNFGSLPGFILKLLVIFAFIGCAPVSSGKNATVPEEYADIQSIAVLPPELPFDHKEKASFHADQLETGQEVLSSLLVEYFQDMEKVKLISQNEYEGLPVDITASRLASARKAGRMLNCDAVMISTIKRYVPFDASQSRPASVAFDYKLIAVDAGQVLCSGSFDETQQTLLENVFSLRRAFKRKFKWITAEELAREGINDKFGKCFYLRRDLNSLP